MQSYKESEDRRTERMQNIKRLRTQVVESKKSIIEKEITIHYAKIRRLYE